MGRTTKNDSDTPPASVLAVHQNEGGYEESIHPPLDALKDQWREAQLVHQVSTSCPSSPCPAYTAYRKAAQVLTELQDMMRAQSKRAVANHTLLAEIQGFIEGLRDIASSSTVAGDPKHRYGLAIAAAADSLAALVDLLSQEYPDLS